MRRVPPSVWVLLGALAALFALRGRALHTPYFWDEVGYYVPAAVSMYRNHFWPIPDLTVPQSYPPLFPLALVAGWWALGFSIATTRVVGFVVSAAAVASAYALGRELFSASVGLSAAALALLAPVFFGQTGFAQPEVMLALWTTLATLALVRGRTTAHAAYVACLLMTKWTAVVALPAFALYALATAATRREGFRRLLAYAPGLALLALWLAFFYAETGALMSTSGSYADANLWDNLAPAVLARRFVVRAEQLLVYDGAWLVAAPLAAVASLWALGRTATDRRVLLLAGLCASYLAFLTASGFLLPRYFVPVAPALAVLGAAAIFRLLPRRAAVAAVAAIALAQHLAWYEVYDTPHLVDGSVAYYDLVASHAAAAAWLEANAPGARVAAAWPVTDELREPFSGYVASPVAVVDVTTFAPGTLSTGDFDVLVEAPAPGLAVDGGAEARRLGLAELARFPAGRAVTVVWGPPVRP